MYSFLDIHNLLLCDPNIRIFIRSQTNLIMSLPITDRSYHVAWQLWLTLQGVHVLVCSIESRFSSPTRQHQQVGVGSYCSIDKRRSGLRHWYCYNSTHVLWDIFTRHLIHCSKTRDWYVLQPPNAFYRLFNWPLNNTMRYMPPRIAFTSANICRVDDQENVQQEFVQLMATSDGVDILSGKYNP